jgi:hypothetical protein
MASNSKIVSMKKFLKGLNAGTGILTQPPGTVVRLSNMIFTQRGSLQTIPGSAIIGQLPSPDLTAIVIGFFANLVSGQAPYYPTLCAPPGGYLYANVTGILDTLTPGSGNPAGSYTFAVMASNSGATVHSDPEQGLITVTTGASFSQIGIQWNVVFGSYYSLYYLPGGPNASQGVLLTGPTQNLAAFIQVGTLPTTPLVTLPVGNNSYNLGLAIGNVQSPSKQVLFTLATAVSIPASPPEPATLAPGDPDFQFNSSSTSTNQYTGGTASVTAGQSGSGTNTQTSTPATGFPAITLNSSQNVQVSLQLSIQLEGLGGGGGGGSSSVTVQYSTDGGSTWNTVATYTDGGTTYRQNSAPTLSFVASNISSLSNLEFQLIATVNWSGGGGGTATGQITASSATVSFYNSYTPYGGIEGFACPIPQILQFAQQTILILGNGYPPQTTNPALLAGATVTALGNTFQATYPNWQASVAWAQGDQISVMIGGTNYLFTAIQGGVSGTTEPTFPTAKGATVTDQSGSSSGGAQSLIWQNGGPITTSIAPRGAAHGIVYAGSLWLFNTSPETTGDNFDGPTCLKMSDTDNPNSWNPVNVAFLGKDDGTQGTGLATFTVAEVGIAPTQSLVCFKEYSTYQIIGVFGANDFQITQAQTNLGCIAARSIQFLPGYGICRLTHMGFAIFNGVNDKVISEEIRPYIFGGTGLDADIIGVDFTFVYLSYGDQSSSPPMYCCACPLMGGSGSLTRLFVYDMVLKAWTIMDLPWEISTLVAIRAGEGLPLFLIAKNDGSGLIDRLFAGDVNWDASSLVPSVTPSNTPVIWSFKTTHVYSEGSSQRAYFNRVTVRGYASQSAAGLVTATIQANGNPTVKRQVYVYPQPVSGQFDLNIDLKLTTNIVQLSLSGQGAVTVDGIDWEVSPKPTGSSALMIG